MALLELAGLGKRYGAVEALAGIDFSLDAGELVALCGDNGAGKSTLIRLVSGADTPSEGEIRIDGAGVRLASPQDALRRGIATIYQDLALAPRMTIWQNIFMGAELLRRRPWFWPSPLPLPALLDKSAMRRTARAYLDQIHIALPDLESPVAALSGGQRQAVAIARALRRQARLIILDEPTAALGVRETREVLDLIRRLNDTGAAILLVSHAMADVVAVARRVIVLKAGHKIADQPTADFTAETLSHLVATGRSIETVAG